MHDQIRRAEEILLMVSSNEESLVTVREITPHWVRYTTESGLMFTRSRRGFFKNYKPRPLTFDEEMDKLNSFDPLNKFYNRE